MAQRILQPESFPDMPEYEKSLSEQVDEILDDVRLTTTTSVGRLFEWIAKNPGPKPVATAAMGVLVKTKVQFTPADKRLGLLYAVHEVFRKASKDIDMNFDYDAWKDALRALVPWAWRKQKEEDQIKIKKSVLKIWVASHWLEKDFVESLILAPGNTPKKQTGGNSGVKRGRPSSSTRSSAGSMGGAQLSNSTANRKPSKNEEHGVDPNSKNDANGTATTDRTADEDEEQAAVFEMGVDYDSITENGSSVPGRPSGDSGLSSSPRRVVSLPIPAPGAIAAAEAAGLPEPRVSASSGSGAAGGVNTVTSSPEGNLADGGSPNGVGGGTGAVAEESVQDAQRRILSLTLDGCALIRRIGTSMKFPVRAMLTAFHLFHHYQWCGSVEAFRFPPSSLPAMCLACLLCATKAEDCNTKLETLLREMRQLEPLLPPMDGVFPLGKRPDVKEVINLEYKLLLSRGFDLEMVHPTEHIAALLALTRAPIEVGELAYEVVCSRVYTDSTLCLEEDPMTCLCAAVHFALLSPMPRGQAIEEVRKGMLEDWPMLCGATKAVLMSYTERLVQSARSLAEFAPAQTFMIDRGHSAPHQNHSISHNISATRGNSTGSGGGGGGGGGGAVKSPHSGRTPERARSGPSSAGGTERRKRTGSLNGSSGGQARRTPPPPRIHASRPKRAAGHGPGVKKDAGVNRSGVGASPAVLQIPKPEAAPAPPAPVLPPAMPVGEDTQDQQLLRHSPMSLVLETTGRGTGGSIVVSTTGRDTSGDGVPAQTQAQIQPQQPALPVAAEGVGRVARSERNQPSLAVQELQQKLHDEIVRQRAQQARQHAGQSRPPSFGFDDSRPLSDVSGIEPGAGVINGGKDHDRGGLLVPPGYVEEPHSIPATVSGTDDGSGSDYPPQLQQQPQQLPKVSSQHPHDVFHQHPHDPPPEGGPVGHGAPPPHQAGNGVHGHGHSSKASPPNAYGGEQQHSVFVAGGGVRDHQHKQYQQHLSVSPPQVGMLPVHEQPKEQDQPQPEHDQQHHHYEPPMDDQMLGHNPNAHPRHHSQDNSSNPNAYQPPEENNPYQEMPDGAGDHTNNDSHFLPEHDQHHHHNQGQHQLEPQYNDHHHHQNPPTLEINYGDVVDAHNGSNSAHDATATGSAHDTGPGGFPVGPGGVEHHAQPHGPDPSFQHEKFASPFQNQQQQVLHSQATAGVGDAGLVDGRGGEDAGASSFVGDYLQIGRSTSDGPSVGGNGEVEDGVGARGWSHQQQQQQQQLQHYDDDNEWMRNSQGGIGGGDGDGGHNVGGGAGESSVQGLGVGDDTMNFPDDLPPQPLQHQQQQQQHPEADWNGRGPAGGGW